MGVHEKIAAGFVATKAAFDATTANANCEDMALHLFKISMHHTEAIVTALRNEDQASEERTMPDEMRERFELSDRTMARIAAVAVVTPIVRRLVPRVDDKVPNSDTVMLGFTAEEIRSIHRGLDEAEAYRVPVEENGQC